MDIGERQAEIRAAVQQSGLEFTNAQNLINNGCIIRYTHMGIGVMMLWRLPGVWFDEHGREVGSKIAREAGYDVKELLKQKQKREAIVKATEAIEAEYNSSPVREVIAEKNGYKVVCYGLNRFNIEFGDDRTPINTKGFITDKDTALKTLNAVADVVAEDENAE